MTEHDRSKALAELLATPLDDYVPSANGDDEAGPQRPAPWGMLIALLVGAVVVLAGYRIADAGDETTATPTTTLAPSTTAAVAEGETFPEGFTAVDGTVAVKIVRIGMSGDDLAVTMVSAVPRGIDASATTPFTGGRWSALLDDGTAVGMRGQRTEPGAPGTVTVLFDPDELSPEELMALRLSERWYHRSTSVTQELDVSGDLPWTMPDRALLDLGDGMQLIVESMELTETGGVVEWSLAGGTELGIVTVEIALEEGSFDGQPRMMIPIARIDRFFFDPETAVPEGTIELSGPTTADGEGIARGFANWSTRLTVTAPADALIPVPEGLEP